MVFYKIIDSSSEVFECKILGILNEKGIDINKCQGQEYDEASTMTGQYNGLQKKIKNLVQMLTALSIV